jgi:hypothetical protein
MLSISIYNYLSFGENNSSNQISKNMAINFFQKKTKTHTPPRHIFK